MVANVPPEPLLRIYRPPSPTTIVARGLDPSLPSFWDFSQAGIVTGPPDVSALQGFDVGSIIDLEGLVRILLGLLAIRMAIDLVAGDRESGTLAALLAQPVSRLTILTSKYLGGLIALLVAVIFSAAVAGLFVRVYSVDVFGGIFRLLLAFSGISLLYLATQLAIGLSIGSLIGSHSRAATVGLTVWALLAVAAPQIVIVTSRILAPVQSRTMLEDGLRQAAMRRLQQSMRELGNAYTQSPAFPFPREVENGSTAPVEVQDLLEKALQKELRVTQDALGPPEEEWIQAQVIQNRWLRQLSWMTPGTAYLQTSLLLTDTGRSADTRWREATRRRREALNILVFDNPSRYSIQKPVPGGSIGFRRHEELTIDQIPPFHPPTATLRERIFEAGPDLLAMALHLGLALVLAAVVFPRVGF
jgi:ABC-type transport system involved in multi-copper enzyme maturation permease subunit